MYMDMKAVAGEIRGLRARRERVALVLAKDHGKFHGHIEDHDLEKGLYLSPYPSRLLPWPFFFVVGIIATPLVTEGVKLSRSR